MLKNNVMDKETLQMNSPDQRAANKARFDAAVKKRAERDPGFAKKRGISTIQTATPTSTTINIDELSTPVQPVVTPSVEPSVPTFPELNQFFAPTEQDTKRQENVSTLEQRQTDFLDQIEESFGAIAKKGETTAQLEAQAGIPELNTQLTEITNELNQTSLDFRRERERITNETGLTAAQKNARLADVGRKQASQLADLEVIRQARSNTLTNAQALVDRKVELQFADEAMRLQGLQFIYNENKDSLTKEQDRAFQTTLQREQRAFDVAKGNYERVEMSKVDLIKNAAINNAPNSVLKAIQQADTLEGAYSAAGGYGLSLESQLTRMNINLKSLEIKEQQKALNAMLDPNNPLDLKPDFDAATFAKRMEDANTVLETTERNIGESIGTIASLGIANRTERQTRSQAERNFINALLRRESGAAISPEEFESARKQYFPSASDTEETRKQKAQNRKVVFEGMRLSSGGAHQVLTDLLRDSSPEVLLNSFDLEETPDQFFMDIELN